MPIMDVPSAFCCSPNGMSPSVRTPTPVRFAQRLAPPNTQRKKRCTGHPFSTDLSSRGPRRRRSSCWQGCRADAAARAPLPLDSRPPACRCSEEPGTSDSQRLRTACVCVGITLVAACASAWLPRPAVASLAISTSAIPKEGEISICASNKSSFSCSKLSIAAIQASEKCLQLSLTPLVLTGACPHPMQAYGQQCVAHGQVSGLASCILYQGRITWR